MEENNNSFNDDLFIDQLEADLNNINLPNYIETMEAIYKNVQKVANEEQAPVSFFDSYLNLYVTLFPNSLEPFGKDEDLKNLGKSKIGYIAKLNEIGIRMAVFYKLTDDGFNEYYNSFNEFTNNNEEFKSNIQIKRNTVLLAVKKANDFLSNKAKAIKNLIIPKKEEPHKRLKLKAVINIHKVSSYIDYFKKAIIMDMVNIFNKNVYGEDVNITDKEILESLKNLLFLYSTYISNLEKQSDTNEGITLLSNDIMSVRDEFIIELNNALNAIYERKD